MLLVFLYNEFMSAIKNIYAREILASGGSPSLEVEVLLSSGFLGKASVSYGVSSGSKEACVLLDKDLTRYNGKGMLKAISNINTTIKESLIGMEANKQREIDERMINLDGSEDKSSLGGNAILGVSLAVARAAANEARVPLYRYLQQSYGVEDSVNKLPKPMMVMIEGGKHADNTTDLQEYMVAALGNKSSREQIRMEMEIYEALKQILKREGLSTNTGNEGAFAPNGITSNEKPLEYLMEAILNAGYSPGVDAAISLDAAASEFWDKESQRYKLSLEEKELSSEEMLSYYKIWLDKYPIISLEDMLSEYDWDNWPKLVEMTSGKALVISDDLTVSNTGLLQKAIDLKASTAILIKLNQAGSLTETIDCCLLAKKYNFATIPSHRGGGETNDTFLVDLAVAMGSEYIKVGPTRGERVCKYNRLMEIEEEILNG
jgi:enolase